jgi:UDP-N-acetylglucosamine diphosphorylase/glucosamine-1-phosphate N-acetyltransferase
VRSPPPPPAPASPALYLIDPDPAAPWAPFAGARPVSELRAGAHLIRERWEAFIGVETAAVFTLPHLAGFVEPGAPAVTARHAVSGPAVIGSCAFAPRGLAPALPDAAFRLTCQGVTVGWGVGRGATWDGPQPHATAVEVAGVVLHGVYDLIAALPRLLGEDLAALAGERDPVPRGSTVIGDPSLLGLHGAAVEPGVVFDTTAGPVVLESGVEVRAGTRLEGPLWAGANTQLLGGAIRGSAIGPHCKVHGELASCVFLGYANKAHDGFVGHSVIGRWANLGAGTITSNLKNTYGPVRLDVAGTPIETGLTNLGSLIGDHAKTAIGTLLSTGSVIGTGANVFDAVRPPRYVPPFTWGVHPGAGRVTRDGFLKIAERVLPRRDVAIDEATRAALGRIYDWATR